ncbi:F0F1 ATP synthase subunit B [Buchnera aphidicola (Taiwanaphis decaspermi)]|uniref:F0F1 ATP synthase subunit B n=1 Tax=Buchnera aphidicola TaxID=9 RepID=UPI0031B88449
MNINATILGQIISFVFFVFFCMKYIWPPILSVIEQRKKKIYEDLQYVKNSITNVKILEERAVRKINKAKKKANKIIQQADQKKILIIKKAKIKAEKEKQRIIFKTHNEINIEKRLIKEKLKKKFVSISMLIAKKIIKNSINESVDEKIINKLASEL